MGTDLPNYSSVHELVSFAIIAPNNSLRLRWQCRDRGRDDFQELPGNELNSLLVLFEFLDVDLGRVKLIPVTGRHCCDGLDEGNNKPTKVVVTIHSRESGKETRARRVAPEQRSVALCYMSL